MNALKCLRYLVSSVIVAWAQTIRRMFSLFELGQVHEAEIMKRNDRSRVGPA